MADPLLVTGAAGFIGFHFARHLARSGARVVGVDNFAPFYDPALKEARLRELQSLPGLAFERLDLADEAATRDLFDRHRPRRVVHLAAQPGVRRSLSEPRPYITANVVAFLNVLEGCRAQGVDHLVYASSSSVYGANRKLPFSEEDSVDHPVNLYAATKKSNELMAHAYAHLYRLPATGLRFFTAYGPWGRPDMAVYAFTDAIAQGRPIEVAHGGLVRRDFTYVDDIVEGMARVLDRPARPAAEGGAGAQEAAPHRVYNIGSDQPVALNQLIAMIERSLGREAVRIDRPLPPGDMLETCADLTALRREIGFWPATPLAEGLERFVAWYRRYHGRPGA